MDFTYRDMGRVFHEYIPITKARASLINFKVGESLNHAVLCFTSSFLNMLGNIPSEE